jgi:Zn-dependent M16 (insulinase) family peptidase
MVPEHKAFFPYWARPAKELLMNHLPPFRILQSEFIPSVRSTVTRAMHTQSGAEFVHVLCEEEREHFFAVCFKTPSDNDTGVPHIIEHTVLNGSRKYPVKDPFMEMVKSSMATFINAITFGDRTLYPCGSLNAKDFRNLVSIYMDSVFHPLLKEESFLQEGYRLDFETPGDTGSSLIHSGVVYNEMMGAYSDPDSYIERELARYLYPDGSCGRDTGGDPLAIPLLTYDAFKEFHEKHYHPSNCCLFTLTQIPFAEMAEFLDERLAGFEAKQDAVVISLQPRLDAPVKVAAPIPGDEEDLCTVTCAWMVNSGGDPVETLAFSLLEDVLLDDDSSPVKTTLIDSELGTGLSGSGYDADHLQRNFIIGLKGVERKDSDEVLELILSCLNSLVQSGLNPELVKNMLHRKELHLREIGSSWPYSMMSTVCAAWTHGEDIMKSLDLSYLLAGLKEKMAGNPRFLEDMITSHFLTNSHRIDAVFYPDEELFEEENKKIAAVLKDMKESMSPEDLSLLALKSTQLALSMNTPNTEEELATLPKLSISDIPKDPPKIFHTEEMVNGNLFLSTEIHTAGVCYVDLCFDMSSLPVDLVPHLPFFTGFLTRTGAAGLSYLEMAEQELRCSGGIEASVSSIVSTAASTDEYRLLLKIDGHCLQEDLLEMLGVMEKRLFSPLLSDTDRIITIAEEMVESGKSSLIPRGHSFALMRAKAGLSSGSYAAELLHGIPALKQVASIRRKKASKEINALQAIQKHLAESAPRLLAWAGPDEKRNDVINWLADLREQSTGQHTPASPVFPAAPVTCGVVIKGGTSFTAVALPGIPLVHPLAVSGMVMMNMLSEGYLWDEIRVKRGAYGTGGSLSGAAVTFYSYRDPSAAGSIQVFRNAVQSGINAVDLGSKTVEDSIIASFKGIDPAVRPSMANGLAILRHMKGMNMSFLEKYRSDLLAVSADSIREFAELLKSREAEMRICVMGNGAVLDSMSIENRIEL